VGIATARKIAFVLGIAGVIATASTAGLAQSGSSEARFIRSLGDRAIVLLADTALTSDQRTAGFAELLSSGFDLDYIGRFVLGRYWNAASAAQRDTYLPLFHRYVIRTYASRLKGYAGETFEIVAQRRAGPRDVIVRTRIARPAGGALIDADWRVRSTGDSYRIIDVMVEGISMAITQRQEFSSVIRRKGIDGLIADLQVRTNGYAKANFDN